MQTKQILQVFSVLSDVCSILNIIIDTKLLRRVTCFTFISDGSDSVSVESLTDLGKILSNFI